MNKKIVYLYSGQGSHYYNMGKSLYHRNSKFREYMNYLDNYAINRKGYSILQGIYKDDIIGFSNFNDIRYSHPAIFMIEYAVSKVLLDIGIYPDYFVGQSLGEISSLTMSGMLPVNDTMELILNQAEILSRDIGTNNGMLAVLDKSELFFDLKERYPMIEMAGVNCEKHFVLSGPKEILNEIIRYLKENLISSVLLPINYGFHSSYIDSCKEPFQKLINQDAVMEAKIPCISCIDGKVRTEFSPGYFWDVIRMPTYFERAIGYTENLGPTIYIDVGPSGTLATFLRYILPTDTLSEIFQIITPFGNEEIKLNQLIQRFVD